ncbi:2573_t:CDS:2, partial [Entrophospora sp. SA101]
FLNFEEKLIDKFGRKRFEDCTCEYCEKVREYKKRRKENKKSEDYGVIINQIMNKQLGYRSWTIKEIIENIRPLTVTKEIVGHKKEAKEKSDFEQIFRETTQERENKKRRREQNRTSQKNYKEQQSKYIERMEKIIEKYKERFKEIEEKIESLVKGEPVETGSTREKETQTEEKIYTQKEVDTIIWRTRQFTKIYEKEIQKIEIQREQDKKDEKELAIILDILNNDDCHSEKRSDMNNGNIILRGITSNPDDFTSGQRIYRSKISAII